MKHLTILIVKIVILAAVLGGGIPFIAYEIQRILGIRIPGGFVAGLALGGIWIASAKLLDKYKKARSEVSRADKSAS